MLDELKRVVDRLVNNAPIPHKYHDHELKGKYRGIRELHLKPDDLLMYIISQDKLTLVALGSHADLF